MKIALLDLNHSTRGIHTNTVPLGLGVISVYLKKNVSGELDVRMFKDTNRALREFENWRPDVVGLAQYSWNSELNLFAAREVKKANPEAIIIAGGPNVYKNESKKAEFLRQENYIDICVVYDGEIIFAEIVRRLLAGETINDIRREPVAGTYSLHPETNAVVERLQNPPRMTTLDVLGTPYADGVFDSFLDEGFHPFVQTHRGCPFRCAFCHTSDSYYNRMLFLSPALFEKDMEYLGRRFQGKYHVPLYIANTNWSLFEQDFEIAGILKKVKEKYGWPSQIHINSGKDPRKLIEMLSVFRYMPGIALQTLTPSVLQNINRKNIPFDEYLDFQNKVSIRTGRPSATELILGLPGETKETFLDTLVRTIDSGTQNIIIYTLMKLRGTPLNTEENERKYAYLVRHRVVPRQFSEINGQKIFDTEAVVVGTNTMTFADYMDLRGLSFTVSAFLASSELIPLTKLLSEFGVRLSDWIFRIHEQLANHPVLSREYQDFLHETESELFPSREALIDFFSQAENYDALCSGKLGDNLLRKYKANILFRHFASFLDLATSEAGKLIAAHGGGDGAAVMLDDLHRFLATRDMKSVLESRGRFAEKTFTLEYDVPTWVANHDKERRLSMYHAPAAYRVGLSGKVNDELESITKMNKDLELSLQILYRDGTISMFWPEWIKPEPAAASRAGG
jgi:radical SAM superfamily enzyme YgiQ (UPF0313 family)